MSQDRDEQMLRALGQRPSLKPVWIGAGVLAVAVVVFVVVFFVGRDDGRDRHFSSLSRCLIGQPLAPGENLFFRIREVELAEALAPSESDPWPARCAPHATALYRSVGSSGGDALLSRLLRSELSCGDDDSTPCVFPSGGHPFGKADEVWKAAEIAGISVVDVPAVPAPPRRLKPAVTRDLPSLGSAKLALADSRVGDNGETWLLFRNHQGDLPLRFCRVTSGGERAACRDVKTSPTQGRLSFLDGREPPAASGRFAGDDGMASGAISLVDGASLKLRGGLRRGFVLEPRGKDLFLIEVVDGLATAQTKADVEPDAEFAIVADQLGTFGLEGESRRLTWRRIGEQATLVGDAIALEGEIPPRVDVCEAGGTSGVVHGVLGQARAVWFVQDGAWSKAVKGRVPLQRANEWGPECSRGHYARHWVVRDGEKYELGRLVCTPAGCKSEQVPWHEKRVKRFLLVTSFGDQSLVLYETFTGGLRLRRGPLSGVSSAEVVLLMDGFEFSGEKLENARVTVGRDHAILTFDDEQHLHALFVSATKHGAVQPN